MVKELASGRNDLDIFLRSEEHLDYLEEILVEGRFLESDFHDHEAPINKENGCREHMHWYRKILKTYDPNKKCVLLSKVGSRRLIKSLDEPDKEFDYKALVEDDNKYVWMVREKDHKLF